MLWFSHVTKPAAHEESRDTQNQLCLSNVNSWTHLKRMSSVFPKFFPDGFLVLKKWDCWPLLGKAKMWGIVFFPGRRK